MSATDNAGIRHRERAEEAIRKIGTNGIPVLLSILSSTNSARTLKANDVLRTTVGPNFYRFGLASDRYASASIALDVLGEDAQPAVSELITLLNHPDAEIRIASIRTLGCIESGAQDSVAPLAVRIADPNEEVRFYAIYAIGQLHRKPEIAIPALVAHLHSSNAMPIAMAALAEFGQNPDLAPVLLNFTTHPETRFREWATNALLKIAPKTVLEEN